MLNSNHVCCSHENICLINKGLTLNQNHLFSTKDVISKIDLVSIQPYNIDFMYNCFSQNRSLFTGFFLICKYKSTISKAN